MCCKIIHRISEELIFMAFEGVPWFEQVGILEDQEIVFSIMHVKVRFFRKSLTHN